MLDRLRKLVLSLNPQCPEIGLGMMSEMIAAATIGDKYLVKRTSEVKPCDEAYFENGAWWVDIADMKAFTQKYGQCIIYGNTLEIVGSN